LTLKIFVWHLSESIKETILANIIFSNLVKAVFAIVAALYFLYKHVKIIIKDQKF